MIRALVVEDHAVTAGALCVLLRRAGFETTWVTDGAGALASVVAADVVVLDTGSAGRDGYEVCRELRERSGVPIVVVSSDDPLVARHLAHDAGADAFLAVPYASRELVETLRRVLADRAAAVLRHRDPFVGPGVGTRCTSGQLPVRPGTGKKNGTRSW